MLCLDEEYPVLAPAIGFFSEGWFHNHVMFRWIVPYAGTLSEKWFHNHVKEYPVLAPCLRVGSIIMLCLGEEYPVLDPAIGSSYEGWFNKHVMFRWGVPSTGPCHRLCQWGLEGLHLHGARCHWHCRRLVRGQLLEQVSHKQKYTL